MRCAVYHPDGVCPDVRDCEGCEAERTAPEKAKEEKTAYEKQEEWQRKKDKAIFEATDKMAMEGFFPIPLTIEEAKGRKPKNTNMKQLDTRENLWKLQEEALARSKEVKNWFWKRAYEDLAIALDTIDAFIARSSETIQAGEVPTNEKE